MKTEFPMKVDVQELSRRVEQLEIQLRSERRRSQVQTGLAFCAVVGAILVSPANRAALAQGYGSTVQQLVNRLAVVENKTRFMSADSVARSTTFSGCNVVINNGSGATSLVVTNTAGEGLGNLILGYNSRRGDGTDLRSGSHNLILGDGNSYSSYGGLVAGSNNTISNVYASVCGGFGNSASGASSFISGGVGNLASGPLSTVAGGESNTASGTESCVSGGSLNTASASISSVGGGQQNVASAQGGSISGGLGITQSNAYGWSGGSQSPFTFGGNFHSP